MTDRSDKAHNPTSDGRPLSRAMQSVRRWVATLTVVSGLVAHMSPGGQCYASLAAPMSLEGVVKYTRIAFAGTVEEISARGAGGTILTDVRFTAVQFADSGRADSAIVLSFEGGKADGREVVVSGAPRFSRGARYIVLASSTGTRDDLYSPIVGISEGLFPLRFDPVRRQYHVYDHHGRACLRIHEGHLVVLAAQRTPTRQGREKPPGTRVVLGVGARGQGAREVATEIVPQEQDPGTRITEREFLGAVHRISAGVK